MKHVSYADKSLFMGDDAADTLLEYARLVADNERADTVTLRSISTDGVRDIKERIDAITRPVSVDSQEPPYVDYDLPESF
jgi:hypothetical protein